MSSRLWLTGGLVVLLGLVVFLSLHTVFSPGRSVRKPPLLYEEIYSSGADLKKNILKIDCAFYKSLYDCGVKEKDVLFLNVQPRHQNGHVWDFAEILVKCPDQQCALKVRRSISDRLSALGSDIRIQRTDGPGDRIVFRVFAKAFQTHEITLRFGTGKARIQKDLPEIAIIIDDLGYNADTDFSFFKLDLPLSFSVLPYGPFTQSVVRKANREGRELLLHLPMEPKNYPSVKPGPGALLLSMDARKIRSVLARDLTRVKGVRGVNNHMGSSFTEDRGKMRVVLDELKKRNLFFVDSRTTRNTVALAMARKLGVPAARRRVFLDNNLEPRAMEIQMERLLGMARHLGSAVGIGHPHRETYALLERYSRKIKARFHMVPVSELVSCTN